MIGKRCANVTVDEALDYVKGYTIANDFGLHDLRHVDRGAMTRVKGIDGYCPIGPFLVDTADLAPNNLTLRTYVNGEMVQEGGTDDDLMFSIAYQVADVVKAMEADSGLKLKQLRVDGGASMNNLLMQFQSDILGVPAVRPVVAETTALGAAYLAGLAVGYWKNKKEIAAQWQEDARFKSTMKKPQRNQLRKQWSRAVERAKSWEDT